MIPSIFGITGWKNSGKTGLTERLVAEFSGRGLKVSTIKHAHHAFDIDKPGTDSHRHRMAGACEVAIVSEHRWAIMHELRDAPEPLLADIVARLSPCDLVLIEGYKSQPHPKIECIRAGASDRPPLYTKDTTISAIACDTPLDAGERPIFDLDDVSAIANFIAEETGLSVK